MIILPYMVIGLVQCKVSLDRLNHFMNNEELDPDAVMKGVSHEEENTAVAITGGNFQWDLKEHVGTLQVCCN